MTGCTMIFAGILIACAISDVVTYEIANGWWAALLLGYFGCSFVSGSSLVDIGYDVAVGISILILGAVIYRFGWLGGGDVKLLAAASPWVGWSGLLDFFFWVALSGGTLAFLILLGRWLAGEKCIRGPAWWKRLWAQESGVPYGVAICGGGLMVSHNLLGG